MSIGPCPWFPQYYYEMSDFLIYLVSEKEKIR